MSKHTIKALFLGDVCGRPGSRALFIGLRQLIRDYHADLVIVNGENAADGFGLLPSDVEMLLSIGVDVITTGNHVWQREEILPVLHDQSRLLRPANYPPGVSGKGVVVIDVQGVPVAVINLQGRQFLPAIDCPFRTAKEIIQGTCRKMHAAIIIVDFHAESVEEKEAMAWYLDGMVALVGGTHTHVQTADERILPKGCAYITDVGMTGPYDSVIGSDPDISIRRQLTQLPLKSEVLEVPAMIQGVCCEIDVTTGKAVAIERIKRSISI